MRVEKIEPDKWHHNNPVRALFSNKKLALMALRNAVEATAARELRRIELMIERLLKEVRR